MKAKENVDNSEEFRCLSLCTGYAGLELGLKRAVPNLRTVCYVEVEAFACANLVSKIEAGKLDAAPIWTDIKTFDGRPFRKKVHIVTAGYPCQPFSVAGKRKGKDDPRHLWPHIERIVKAVQPIYCFFENVSGHISIGYPEVYRSLRLMGYKVEAGLFTAAECGAPHRRQRLFILAYNTTSRCEDVQIKQKRQSTFRNGCRSLADTEYPEQGQGIIEETQAGVGRDRFTERGMADSSELRLQGSGYAETSGQAEVRWPSRPGQPQHEWEEPRVVDNDQQRRYKSPKRKIQTRRDGVEYTDEGQAQSKLGRAANGTRSRVDRLRLLGNGVVPQQAERAFRYLMSLNDFEANK